MCTPDWSTSISTSVVMFLCKPVAEKCVKFTRIFLAPHVLLQTHCRPIRMFELYWKFLNSSHLPPNFNLDHYTSYFQRSTFLSPPLLFDVIHLMLCNYYIISVMIMLYYVTILYMQFIAVYDNDEMTFSTNQCLFNLAN